MTVTEPFPATSRTRRALLVEPDAWPVLAGWLGSSGLSVDVIPVAEGQIPRHHVTAVGRVIDKRLSPRELEVLQCMAMGMSNPEIAARFHLSEDTVKTHARRLFRTLGVRDRAHAVAVGYQVGILGGRS